MFEIRRFPILFGLVLAPMIFQGCATTAPAAPPYTPNFNFSYQAIHKELWSCFIVCAR